MKWVRSRDVQIFRITVVTWPISGHSLSQVEKMCGRFSCCVSVSKVRERSAGNDMVTANKMVARNNRICLLQSMLHGWRKCVSCPVRHKKCSCIVRKSGIWNQKSENVYAIILQLQNGADIILWHSDLTLRLSSFAVNRYSSTHINIWWTTISILQ